ncbi:MAG: S1 RNA-binding domain-containing protein [Candidatus Pacearchaeota archaeon]
MEENDLVMCVVEKIEGTAVFVKINNNIDGTINFSEIAAGRIRNIRDYVFPGKRIVCKVLRINPNGVINLSLRRVTEKERKDFLEKYQKENASINIIKKIALSEADKIISEIKKENENIYEFLQKSKENPSLLDKYFTKEQANEILEILKEKKEKEKEIKKNFYLKTKRSDGIEVIKKILFPYKDYIIYLGSSKFRIAKKSSNYKQTEKEIDSMLESIEKEAKKEKCEFLIEK